eukprot:1819136-Pleurochrysis_carterae.AAC.2
MLLGGTRKARRTAELGGERGGRGGGASTRWPGAHADSARGGGAHARAALPVRILPQLGSGGGGRTRAGTAAVSSAARHAAG